LDYLGLARNKITDVSPLSGLTSLGSMHLYDNNITDVSFLSGLTSLTFLDISSNNIEGQNVGNVDDLATLVNANILYLYNNIGMSCSELDSLINALNSPPVDIDGDINTTDVATDGVNCTNP
jgi:internalin A